MFFLSSSGINSISDEKQNNEEDEKLYNTLKEISVFSTIYLDIYYCGL